MDSIVYGKMMSAIHLWAGTQLGIYKSMGRGGHIEHLHTTGKGRTRQVDRPQAIYYSVAIWQRDAPCMEVDNVAGKR